MKWVAEKGDIVLTVLEDNCPENPRNWSNLGSMVCFHDRYSLGDEHGYSDINSFLKDLLIEYGDIEKILKQIASQEWDWLRFVQSEDDEDLWLLMYRDSTGCWIEELDFDMKRDLYEELLEALVDLIEVQSTNAGWWEDVFALLEDELVVLPLYLYDHSVLSISTYSFQGRAPHASWDSGQIGWIYCSKKRFLQETGYTAEQLFKEGKAEEILRGEVEVYNQYLQGEVYGFKLEKKIVCPHCCSVKMEEVNSCWGFYGDDFEHNGLADYVGDIELVRALQAC